ncbi:MAG: hypothetical protein IJT31_05365, partial [Oscillibacter sp.]|nr:hypothetical protein [Oscillibacter sp.]
MTTRRLSGIMTPFRKIAAYLPYEGLKLSALFALSALASSFVLVVCHTFPTRVSRKNALSGIRKGRFAVGRLSKRRENAHFMALPRRTGKSFQKVFKFFCLFGPEISELLLKISARCRKIA